MALRVLFASFAASRFSFRERSDLAVSDAAHEMVVHHAGRLHVGIDDGRADESKAALLQVAGDGLGERRRRRHVGDRPPGALNGATVDEAPDVLCEAPERSLHVEKGASVADRRLDLEPVADDAGIGHQPGGVFVNPGCDPRRFEARKGPPVCLALAQDRQPAQPGLRTLEGEELEQGAVVADRHPPLAVVVVDIEGSSPHHGHLAVGCSGRRGIVSSLVTGEAQPNLPRENPGKELRLLLQRPALEEQAA